MNGVRSPGLWFAVTPVALPAAAAVIVVVPVTMWIDTEALGNGGEVKPQQGGGVPLQHV